MSFCLCRRGTGYWCAGQLQSFRGELEVSVDHPDEIWRYAPGEPLLPLEIEAAEVGESLEGRLVTFIGVVSGWRGQHLLERSKSADTEPVRVTVGSSPGWRRPYVLKGEGWRVRGMVSQFAREHPWNGDYRVLVCHREDLVTVGEP